MRFAIHIEGGPHDGVYEGDTEQTKPTAPDEAQAIWWVCHEKPPGGRFWAPPPHAMEVLLTQGVDAAQKSGMTGHTYEVVERQDDAGKITIRCKHVDTT